MLIHDGLPILRILFAFSPAVQNCMLSLEINEFFVFILFRMLAILMSKTHLTSYPLPLALQSVLGSQFPQFLRLQKHQQYQHL